MLVSFPVNTIWSYTDYTDTTLTLVKVRKSTTSKLNIMHRYYIDACERNREHYSILHRVHRYYTDHNRSNKEHYFNTCLHAQIALAPIRVPDRIIWSHTESTDTTPTIVRISVITELILKRNQRNYAWVSLLNSTGIRNRLIEFSFSQISGIEYLVNF